MKKRKVLQDKKLLAAQNEYADTLMYTPTNSRLGKMVMNDLAESPFATPTHHMQTFGKVLGIHASAIGQQG